MTALAHITHGTVVPARFAAADGQGGFIVELAGPAAAGKTTLARALDRELKARGVPARLVASLRPGEKNLRQVQASAAVTVPLWRASKLIDVLGALVPGASTEPLVRQLLEALPPKGWIRLLRVRRYLRNLCRSWNAASMSQDVAIFDQGFMNSLYSLALFSGLVDRDSLARGLSLLPAPDLLIRVNTPREVLETRLKKRLRNQARVERWFERDIESALRQVELCSCVDDLLAERGRASLHVSWRDADGLAKAADAIVCEIMSRKKGRSA